MDATVIEAYGHGLRMTFFYCSDATEDKGTTKGGSDGKLDNSSEDDTGPCQSLPSKGILHKI